MNQWLLVLAGLTIGLCSQACGTSGGAGNAEEGGGTTADSFEEDWTFTAYVSTSNCVGIGCPRGALFEGSMDARTTFLTSDELTIRASGSVAGCDGSAEIRISVPYPAEQGESYPLNGSDSHGYYVDCASGIQYSTDNSPSGAEGCAAGCSGHVILTHYEDLGEEIVKVAGTFNFNAIQRFNDSPVRMISDGEFSNF